MTSEFLANDQQGWSRDDIFDLIERMNPRGEHDEDRSRFFREVNIDACSMI